MLKLAKSRSRNAIHARIANDEATRLRLKYDPYYRSFDRQEGTRVWIDGQELIMLASNDYLGLPFDPRVQAAATEAVAQWGTSTTGARMSNGTRHYHRALEERLAAFLGVEAVHVSAAGYLSCMSPIATFALKGDLIVVDRNVHSSLWSGIIASGAAVERFSHNNADHLAEVLGFEDPNRSKLLVLEGVYSMEGHIAKLPELLGVAQGHNCFVVLDDAHGIGVMGPEGRGTAAHFDLRDRIDVLTGSFSKSLASTGGFVAGSSAVIEYLRTHSKQMIFSAALAPSQAAAALKALEIVESEPEHRARLWENTRYYKRILDDLGFSYWESESPAVPLIMGGRERAYHMWRHLFEQGIFTVMAVAPGVPPGKDLLRTSVSALHTREQLDRAGEALALGRKRLGW